MEEVVTLKKHIHLFGASGSGTTSIGKRLAELLGYSHFDSDDYFWMPTKEPFTAERPNNECMAMLEKDLMKSPCWTLSGSLTGWGDALIPYLDLAVFVTVPRELRIERIKRREYERYGEAMLPGGSRYEAEKDFLNWCAAYEDGTRNGRSLQKHEAWLKQLGCSILRIVNLDFEESVQKVIEAINE